ncbi:MULTISPECIES: DUF29 domain-containing protein [unclassified Endozoicomonas]|uniref:DUF29 domain-containing protein n=1 Tax=unclassified Endozoicomonas TaxID=2644528 RepID=UPI0021480DE5|nr:MULTISPECIES: DUF29 domain-containing protein [unclassified Endozoicomonas]
MENLYDTDFYSWSYRQAELIKQGRFDELDIANLVEEIEDMGKAQYQALRSCTKELLLHLLKWQIQSGKDDQHTMTDWYRSWLVSVAKQRGVILDLLEDNPSLNSKIDEVLPKAYRSAKRDAAADMKYKPDDFPAECPWSFEQIMTEDWLPES